MVTELGELGEIAHLFAEQIDQIIAPRDTVQKNKAGYMCLQI